MFGEIRTTRDNDSIQTVALSSPHVISSGDIACTSTGERFGEPESKANIHDVSVVKTDSSVISSLQQTIVDKQIEIREIPKENLRYRVVFKYGATTKKNQTKQVAQLNK